ncbi:MAG: nucleoside phosphorylase [Clostridia bacterium]|nr:nucleoside phosphorylase [Clostridia bacterium]
MKWFFEDDKTQPILTADAHIASMHIEKKALRPFPETAMLFYMHSGEEYLIENHGGRLLMEKLPRFLRGGPVYALDERICFMDGGRGAPQAVDTVETLAALGVKRIITVGMFGAFGESVETGDVIVPSRVLIEEGTSHHYLPEPEYAFPDEALAGKLAKLTGAMRAELVSTDSIYRQTYFKERLWREKGAVGVDMETSAIFTVSKCLGISAAALLIASDKHPTEENAGKWEWRMTKQMRYDHFESALAAARAVAQEN